MRSEPIALIPLGFLLVFSGLSGRAEDNPSSPEVTAITQQVTEYAKAYDAGDAKALSEFFTEDVEYTDEDGNLTKGRSDIEKLLTDTFAQNKGATIDIQINSVRALGPDVYEEDGSSTVTSPDGGQQSSKYSAIHVKKDGKLLISRLFEFPLPDATPADQLSQLAWMIGTWKDKGGSPSVETTAQWARGNNFITRTFKVSQADDVLLEGWQIIGWDPVEQQIRSWIFDSDGGYGQSFWTRDGDRWLIKETRVSAEGDESSAEQTLTYVDQDHCTFESVNRTLNGDLLPNIDKVEIERVNSQ
jgi:uncharacterized protein (TIGR02246 family)